MRGTWTITQKELLTFFCSPIAYVVLVVFLGFNGYMPLFCTLQGKPLKSSYVRTLLPRLADKADIEKRVHPHGLRHTHAYELMTEGVPVPIIQQQLGHTSLATTDRYVSHLAPVDLISHMQQRDWSL